MTRIYVTPDGKCTLIPPALDAVRGKDGTYSVPDYAAIRRQWGLKGPSVLEGK